MQTPTSFLRQSKLIVFSLVAPSVIAVGTSIGIGSGLTGCSSSNSRHDPGKNGYPKTVEFESNQLMMKSADEISEVLRRKIKRANAIQAKQIKSDDDALTPEEGAVRELREAMRIVLARPDEDGTRAAGFARVRRELQDLNSVNSTLKSISDEGIAALKSETLPTRRQATYLVVLDNLMAEIRPEAPVNPAFHDILVDIKNADIDLTDELRSQARLNAMYRPLSPSETAKAILAKDPVEGESKKKK